ncbi:TolC family protein, partial [Paraburkholderia sp. SIMBA_050]
MNRPFRILVLTSVAAGTLALAGCAVQPAQHPALHDSVQSLAPAAWDIDVPRADIDAAAWWARFHDPVLDRLIATVLDGNLDLQAATERVKQAQALTVQKRAALLPELDATARASDARQNTPPPLGYVRQAGIGLALSWSPDVFGGERLDLLAAQAE